VGHRLYFDSSATAARAVACGLNNESRHLPEKCAAKPDKNQRAWEKMQQREIYEHDKMNDVRRQTLCI